MLALVGCSQTLQRQTCVALAKGVDYCLAPIPLGDQWQRSATQKAAINVADAHHELLTQVELDANSLTLVGLAPLGQALFTLIYDGETLTSEQSSLLGSEFKAEYLLALMQLIYWPEESVNAHLQGAILTSDNCDAPRCRKIYATNSESTNKLTPSALKRTLVEIEYSQKPLWQSEVLLQIPQANFELKISPL
ncbi:DUF3261 domain-containing protein [Shewanella sp. UCD-KL12]|uniref:DUF3261 domain-containing protein n=1 Tax=Shewanella sp. UCD-KL12 TaxID=1917163 RepID=UPI0009FACAF9|nr:DUF3261 domain-containing protein [Shewanella sp. UCD-KL12]